MNPQVVISTTDLRIERIGGDDVRKRSPVAREFEKLVLQSEQLYPEIGGWLRNSVYRDLVGRKRVALLGRVNGRPAVSAVLKVGGRTKFCHLRVHEGFQRGGLGDLFFSLMALEVRHEASSVHFTLPASLWEESHEFFESFGFKDTVPAGTQYRLFDRELHCEAPYRVVWRHTIGKLPRLLEGILIGGRSPNPEIILSVKPRYGEAILDGRKRIEVRRRFSSDLIGRRVAFYASSPVRGLIGEARIASVDRLPAELLWHRSGGELGCTREEYLRYVGSAHEVNAIRFRDPIRYLAQIPLSQLSHLAGSALHPPESHLIIRGGSDWAIAVAVGALLHGGARNENP